MIYELRMPRIVTEATLGRIETLYVRQGDSLSIGQKLFDLSIDLSARYSQNCPPISYYRMVARERGFVRALSGALGSLLEPDAVIGLVSADAEEPLGGPPARALRMTTAGIIWHERMWSANAPT
jgi:hypothetical protein